MPSHFVEELRRLDHLQFLNVAKIGNIFHIGKHAIEV